MVYVSIDDISFDEGGFFVDMSVMGFKPSGCIEAVEFLTNVFEKMEYDYLRSELPLRRLGYYIAELSRRKIYLGMVPINTYLWSPGWKPSESEDEPPVCVFIDVGSPLRHAYIAYNSHEVAGGITYWIEGGGLISRERLSVKADFHEGEPLCTASWCDKYLEAVRDKTHSKELYIGVYPSPVDEKHKRKLELVKKVLKLAGLI
jgi:hypothetical protein